MYLLRNRFLLIMSAMVLASVRVGAVPAKRVQRILTLADGKQVTATLRGDELAHYYIAEDGRAYQEQADGTFAECDATALEAKREVRLSAENARRAQRAQKRKANFGAASNPISGSRKGLVLLVDFPDKKFNVKYGQAFYERYFNEEGFSSYNMGGSVHDYFYGQSYGQFDLSFDVVGPVTVSKNYSYYGKNDFNGDDKYAATMVIEACKLAEGKGVDYSQYDWDNDGYVDQVFVLYAGYGESQGGEANTIWPHEYCLSEAKEYGDGSGIQLFDGVYVDTYACSSELAGGSGSSVDGIGTACHEFSHCLGLPDFYDTRVNGYNFGMDAWDLMDYGSYSGKNGNGECPVGFTSYERMYCGWLTPTELTEYTEVKDLQCLDSHPEAYIIYNEANRNEYYLLENRQQEGWFRYSFGHGMLVLHVDFSSSAWENNTVNNTSTHQRMSIIPADNKLTAQSYVTGDYTGDLWPGTSNKKELTNTSVPAAKLFNANKDGKKLMNFPIRDIAENTLTGTISFVAGEVPSAVVAPWQHESCTAYDLKGQRADQMRKGIYIYNGKKVAVWNN